jgi:hypothetical protein
MTSVELGDQVMTVGCDGRRGAGSPSEHVKLPKVELSKTAVSLIHLKRTEIMSFSPGSNNSDQRKRDLRLTSTMVVVRPALPYGSETG